MFAWMETHHNPGDDFGILAENGGQVYDVARPEHIKGGGMVVRIHPDWTGCTKVTIVGTWRITVTVTADEGMGIYDFMYVVPMGQSQRSDFILKEREQALDDLRERLVTQRQDRRHYLLGDLNASVGNIAQQVNVSENTRRKEVIKRSLVNNKKDARGRWLQLQLTAQEYLVVNGTKGSGDPTHFGKGKPSCLDLAIVNMEAWKRVEDLVVEELAHDSDHCVVDLYVSKKGGRRAKGIGN